MPNTTQIILRLLLSLVFGLIIGFFVKGKNVSEIKKYPLLSLLATSFSLFFLEIFFKIYSKIEIMLLPAMLVIGLFLITKESIKKEEDFDKTINETIYLLLVVFVGSCLGFGLYSLSIFTAFIFLVFITLFPLFAKIIKKIRKKWCESLQI